MRQNADFMLHVVIGLHMIIEPRVLLTLPRRELRTKKPLFNFDANVHSGFLRHSAAFLSQNDPLSLLLQL